jgi:RNA polymerase sigma factor (sigma-70 family)
MAARQPEAIRTDSRRCLDAAALAGISDSQLLARFAAARDELSEVAFAALVRRHGPMVLYVCRQILGDPHAADDAFQATFLVLARRAHAIRQPELLGNWLHGVALRTAREARMQNDRRRRRETRATVNGATESDRGARGSERALVRREELEVLHEEVARLPEKQRAVVVLCALEGLTYQEAALRLCCPIGTIGVRLSRARDRLRVRLTQRGLAPSAALLAGAFGAAAVSAAMPPVLVDSAVEAASALSLHEAAASGVVSQCAVRLAEAVLRTMLLKRLKTAAQLLVTITITATVGWMGVQNLLWPSNPPGQTALPPNTAVRRPEGDRPQPDAAPAPIPVAHAPTKQTTQIETNMIVAEPPAPSVAPQRRQNERALGAALFAKEWVRNDPTSHGGDGLGPVFNETSCIACHGLGSPGGAGPAGKNVVLLSATPVIRNPAPILDQIHPGFHGTRSTVLHRSGTDPEYASWRQRFYESNRGAAQGDPASRNVDSIEARITALKGQTDPDRRVRDRTLRQQPSKDYTFALSERNPPPLFGAGPIDAIPSEVLIATAEQQPPSVRGRFNRTPEGRIGRFGWKAQIASLHEFVRAACANELGLEVPGHPQATAPFASTQPAKGLDMNDAECDALVAYVRALPAPLAVDPSGPQGSADLREGRRLFAGVGCTSCHTPELGAVRGIYSDLLLHDMGPSLSDSGTYYGVEGTDSPGGPSPQEWRTPPLWGYRDSAPYLHDGRAQDLGEAVALHEGQGKMAARRFFTLSHEERAQVETFLKSLVAPTDAASAAITPAASAEAPIGGGTLGLPEVEVRRIRDDAAGRDERLWREEKRQQQADESAKRARAQLAAAAGLEKINKIAGALAFYREIVRAVPDTIEGRWAAARIAALRAPANTP